MNKNLNQMYTELGLDIPLHDQLMEHSANQHNITHRWQKNRPKEIEFFDNAPHASHADRVEELYNYRKAGGKSIGTFCIYIPDEIALAADVVPFSLCGGTGFSVSYADKIFPREICPLVRSTFGMAISNTCPYKKLKDFAIGETTCDAKKKAWDLLGIRSMELPQKKNPVDRDLWVKEVIVFKEMVENLSGIKITPEKLKEKIILVNKKRKLLQQIDSFRKMENPPISGLDALLVMQTALNQDILIFNQHSEKLVKELEERARQGISAYPNKGPRVLIAGTPSPMGYAKVHYVAESSGLQVVADESCTGLRYFRDLVDESPNDLNGMIEAIADRYFTIDCPCFSPNTERLTNISTMAREYRIQGVIQSILSFCHGFNIEAKVIENKLNELQIPSLKIVTDYSNEDTEQLRVRVEAFKELL